MKNEHMVKDTMINTQNINFVDNAIKKKEIITIDSSSLSIRLVHLEDAAELLDIYRPYVTDTAITFEYEVPTLEEFQSRIKQVIARYPYLVGQVNGQIVGYVYASPFKGRRAYDWSVETSIYIRQGQHGKGYGKQLYLALESLLRQQNIKNVNACIAYTNHENPYLTNDSMYFHQAMNYQLVGHFHQCGYKYRQWFDMIWMEKMIGEHLSDEEAFIPFSELPPLGTM